MTTAAAATITNLPRSWVAARRRASIRMAELFRLATFRQQYGITLAPDLWLFALAATLASAPAVRVPIGRRGQSFQWHGLDAGTLLHWVSECRLGQFSISELSTVINAVERVRERNGHTLIRSDEIARMLSVTAEERWLCNIKTIGAIDETREERKARHKVEKNERDRERIRATRAGQHRPQALSLSARKPWEAAGVSRATWYRQQAETTLSPDLKNIGEATKLSHEPERSVNADEAALPSVDPAPKAIGLQQR